jgi:hypothetical protein
MKNDRQTTAKRESTKMTNNGKMTIRKYLVSNRSYEIALFSEFCAFCHYIVSKGVSILVSFSTEHSFN